MGSIWRHFKTITHHRLLVMKGCFAVGLYRQGLMHDLSKYSPEEFFNGVKYYQGYRSPNVAEREEKGYSAAWLHHKGRNKHHFEYWIDYADCDTKMVPAPMPNRYIVEMFEDRLAASKVYLGDKYTDASALEYYNKGDITPLLHPKTKRLLEKLLTMNAKYGEEATNRYIRRKVLHNVPSKCRRGKEINRK
ncbi:MAG: catalase [Lachnospiraceae bacterium]|nr:catalase [Lachnospiraceae bacterium]